MSTESTPAQPIVARMRFDDPAKFLLFYDKQLAARVVGLRHAEAVPDGTPVHLTVHPPGAVPPVELDGRTVKTLPRADGSVRLRVAVEAAPGVVDWLDAFAAGLRVGLERPEPESDEPAESLLAESVFGDALTQSIDEEIRSRLARLETQTYYQILDVPLDVDSTALTSTYHGLTRRFHPDLFGQSPTPASRDAGRLYRRINEAYAVLKDPRRRRLYDRGLAGPPHTWTLRLTEEAEQQAQRQRRIRRGDTPLGQTYWKMAREVLERARENEANIRPALRESARLLRSALAFEPENEHFRHALDHVTYRLSAGEGD